MIKTKFLQTCLGISMVTVSVGFLFQSVQKANASTVPPKVFQPETNKVGKYTTTVLPYGGSIYAVTCETETGQISVNYYDGEWKRNEGKWQINATDK